MRCSGRKIIFNRKSELGACPPRALLDAPRVQPSDARWPGFPRGRGKPRPRRARSPIRLRISDLSALQPRYTCLFSAPTGRHRAPSLPVKLRTFAIAEINEWPVFRVRDQFLADGIVKNVIRLLEAAFVVSQAVLEEVALPYDAEFLAVHSFHLLMISFSVFPDGGKESNACKWSGMSRNRYGHHKNFS